MSIQQLYKKSSEIACKLYANTEDSITALNEVVGELGIYLGQLILENKENIEQIQEVIETFYDAVKNQDKLLLADIMYFDICWYLIEKAHAEGIILEDEEKHKYIEEQNSCMLKNIYKNNIQSMQKMEYIDSDKIIEFCDAFSTECDDVLLDFKGNIAVYKENRWWGLNSFCNSKQAAKYATAEIINRGYISMLFVFGIANTDYIKQLIKNISSDTYIYIYEPDKNVFAMNMYYHDMRDIFERKNTFLFVEEINEKQVLGLVYLLSTKSAAKYIQTFISPGYEMLYNEKLKEEIDKINNLIENSQVKDNTVLCYNQEINYNRIMNIPLVYNSVLLSDLKKAFSQKGNLKNIPAIIIAAGPSLDGNIEQLKQVQGKAFIIAVDSAIRMCAEHHIVPDAVVTIDACKQEVLFDNELVQKLPVFYGLHSRYSNIKKLQGEKIFCHVDNLIPDDIADKMEAVSAGGSVSNTAFSIVEYLGFETIIAVGLDLAFKGQMKHASVVYEDGGVNDREADLYTYVKGQNGEQLQTYSNFIMYKEHFEKKIKENKKLTFINATEGGAYIEGAEHMPLSEAIKLYCNKEENFSELIQNCPIWGDDHRQERIENCLKRYIEQCRVAQQYYAECVQNYECILNTTNINTIKKRMKKIDAANEKMSKMFISQILTDYSLLEAEQQLDKIYFAAYKNEDSASTEFENIVKGGINMSELFKKNAEKAEQLFEQCLNEYRVECQK